MSLLEDEIDANSKAFRISWTAQIQANWQALGGESLYIDSYRRLSGLNAIKASLVSQNFSPESAAFYFEAHNDALVSHVSASFGSWRSALQALRSFIENALSALYYKDHPVELALWDSGEFRIGVSEMLKYFEKHPMISDVERTIGSVSALRAEYATLSKAVHASAVDFRMTAGETVLLWDADRVRASKWATREKRVLEGVALLYICIFRDKLTSTKNAALRDVLGFMVSDHKRKLVWDNLRVSIAKP